MQYEYGRTAKFMSKLLFGKIFISHSSIDKPVARKIFQRLQKEGYDVWLDEMDLKLGDKLTTEIGNALARAKIVIVLVSENSLRSQWFNYEINIAIERMIKEEIKLIPLLIDNVNPPDNLRGILYGNLKSTPKKTWVQLMSAIDLDYKHFEFTSTINSLSKYTREVFGPISHSWSLNTGPFNRDDADSELLTVDINGEEFEIIYTEARAYSDQVLSLSDWSEYQDILSKRGWNSNQEGQYSLLVTDYSLSTELKQKLMPVAPRSFVYTIGSEIHMVADLSGNPKNEERIQTLKILRGYIRDSLSQYDESKENLR